MPATGGSIESVSLNGRTLGVAADSGSNRKLGGFENEVLTNGNGTSRIIKIRVSPALGDTNLSIDNSNDDQEFLQGLADGNEFFPVTITYPDGSVYTGSAMITGEVQYSNQSATATVSLMGEGKFVRQ